MRASNDRLRATVAAIFQASLIAIIAIVPSGFAGFFHPHRPPYDGGASRVPEITYEVAQKWDEAPIWVDARSQTKFEQGHIEDAIALNPASFDEQLGSFLDAWEPGRRVVVYCDSQDCGASQEIAARLRDDAGITGVYVLAGGYRSIETVPSP
jgi:rhodanese-related sulfurtransferase